MTYLESITFRTGKFLQLSSYVLKNAYRVYALTEVSDNLSVTGKCDEMLNSAEALAQKLFLERASLGDEEVLAFFRGKGLSTKEYKALEKMLLNRTYLMSSFYLDFAYGFSKEDFKEYEKAIALLEDYNAAAEALNISLSKSAEKLYNNFY